MTQMVIDVDPKYDKMLGILKAQKEVSSKSKIVEKIVETFFDKNIELD